VLCLLLYLPKRFIPSLIKPNIKFLVLYAKSWNSLLILLHRDPSVACLNILSCLWSSLCHHINLACALFLNKYFKYGIIGKYHITILILLTAIEDAIIKTCLYLLYVQSRGHTTYFASYVVAGDSLSFRIFFFEFQ